MLRYSINMDIDVETNLLFDNNWLRNQILKIFYPNDTIIETADANIKINVFDKVKVLNKK